MASQLHDRTALLRPQPQLPWIVRQALLVPEGTCLLVLLFIHWLSGSALVALIGIGVIALFGVRFGLMTAARSALAQAQYRRARKLLVVALWLHPWSADTLALQGLLLLATGQAGLAENALRKAIKFFPDQAVFHATLSSVLLELDRCVEARWEAMRALSLDPNYAPTSLYIAQIEQRLGAPATDVEQRLRQGLALQSDPATEGALRCALAHVLLSLGQEGEARLAVAGVESLATRCSPVERAGLLYQLGAIRRAQGDNDTARSYFSASEQLDPNGRHAAAAWRAARL